MAAPWESTAETGNKLQSYCECWSAGKTGIDGTVEIQYISQTHLTTHKHTHTHTHTHTGGHVHTQSEDVLLSTD